MNRRSGYTLLEVMASIAILAMVSGMLFTLARALQNSVQAQEAKLVTQDEARAGMEFVVRELRQSAGTSLAGTPGAVISYRIADDLDGNGSAVNVDGDLELTPVRTLQRDTADANRDGRRADQLVMVSGDAVRVVANGLAPNEDLNGNGILDGGEDTNQNNVLDRGLWFQRDGQAVRFTIQTQRRAGPTNLRMTSSLTEVVVPRN